ncbi:MAG: hypothetical protein HYX34_07250 [Actinobacteria bacterium]|nr:hypothetical protein [Actinomycetota bacterium]
MLVTVGCSRSGDARSPIAANDSGLYSCESLRDWKDLGDAVIVGRLQSETSFPASTSSSVPEPFFGRLVTVAVERVVFSVRSVPDRITVLTLGWQADGQGNRQPLVSSDGTRLEVGDEIVASIRQDPTKPGVWYSPGEPRCLVRVSGGTVVVAERGPQYLRPFAGISADAMAGRVAAEPVDPLSLRYRDLPAIERAAKVLEARDAASSSSTTTTTTTSSTTAPSSSTSPTGSAPGTTGG